MVDTEQLLACEFEAPTPTDFEGRAVLCWILERGRGSPVFLTVDRLVEPPIAVVLDAADQHPDRLCVIPLREPAEVLGLIIYLQRLIAAERAVEALADDLSG